MHLSITLIIFILLFSSTFIHPQKLGRKKLFSNINNEGDGFGWSVSASENAIVVGAPDAKISGNFQQGAVYIKTNWVDQLELLANDGKAYDYFGHSVSISGNTLVVGAFGATISKNFEQGAVYVFTQNGSTWDQQQKLIASDGNPIDNFGWSVSISGNTIVIGAFHANVSGNIGQGNAYVFTQKESTWIQQQKLIANDGNINDLFGCSVSISGNTIVIGALYANVSGNAGQGATYVFTQKGSTWIQQQKLIANDGKINDYFGNSVSISGNTIVIGAYYAAISKKAEQGAAYVFTLNETNYWIQQQQLISSDGNSGDNFGFSVSISGNTIVVGSPQATIFGNPQQGAGYVFTQSGSKWTQQQKLVASDGKSGDNFGFSESILVGSSSILYVIGAPAKKLYSGAVYIFSETNLLHYH